MRYLLAALICLLGLQAEAADRVFSFKLNGMGYALPAPPFRYIKAPYVAPREVRYLPADNLLKSCSLAMGRPEPLGCTVLLADISCTILINGDLERDIQKIILVHEDAHCRGWPGDHPSE